MGLWGTHADDVWAVGSGGTILHFDGSEWRRIPLDPGYTKVGLKDTLSITRGSPDDVWIVSARSVILPWARPRRREDDVGRRPTEIVPWLEVADGR